jgi:tRNA(Glu) U13 pseudouridine synthase TruD
VGFVLPKGAYATTVLSNVFDVIDASRGGMQPSTETSSGDLRTEDE